MGTERWQNALATELAEPAPCFMCSETLWWRCHRRLIAELLHARGERVVHLLGPSKQQGHKPLLEAETREGRLYLCGALVASPSKDARAYSRWPRAASRSSSKWK
jgi:hypothetical protein